MPPPLPPTSNTPPAPGDSASWLTVMWQNFPRRQVFLGAIIPLGLFYLCSRTGRPLLGALLGGSWGLGVGLFWYRRYGHIDPFAGMGTGLAVMQLLLTVITRNPAFYLASEALGDALLGMVFLASLFGSRSLIQMFAEEMGAAKRLPESLRQTRFYVVAWRVVTAVWGGVYLGKAVLLLLAQWWLALEAFLVLRIVTGWPVWALLFAFSFWFPGWYWKRRRVYGVPLSG